MLTVDCVQLIGNENEVIAFLEDRGGVPTWFRADGRTELSAEDSAEMDELLRIAPIDCFANGWGSWNKVFVAVVR